MEDFFKRMNLDQKIAHFETAEKRLQEKQEAINNEANQFNAELKACWGIGIDDKITIPNMIKLMKEVVDATKTSTSIRP